MVAVVKSEWHQVEKRYGADISRDLLEEIYPDMEPDELDLMYVQMEAGERDIEEILEDAWNENIEVDWEWLDEDDWWTDRKGGYEVTYEVDATRDFGYSNYNLPLTVDSELVPCFSCGAMHDENKLPEIKESGYYCPDCHENWVMMDSREEESVDDEELKRRLDELKVEFDFMLEVEEFKKDESIHQEIRDAFVKIIESEEL